MKTALYFFIISIVITLPFNLFAQKYIARDIKSFGAKGDGKTNDHEAFQKAAAFFNNRGGNGKLIISKGIYIVGKQAFTGGQPGKSAYEGEDVLKFVNIKNLKVIGSANTVFRFKDSLRFGSFTPATGMPYQHKNGVFRVNSYAAFVGSCIHFYKCSNVSVFSLTMDGNNKGLVLGGTWADGGIQLVHYGIFIETSNNVSIDKVNIHHFGLDGICVANEARLQKDSINILNSSFEYNSRQGFSWVGGNDVTVKNCKFNHTGKSAFSSAPSAGVDIEAEVGPISNGHFTNCEFVDNGGAGILASTGDDSDCTFTNCTIWGATNYSIWVTKPAFTFNKCNVFGAIVWGYNSPDEKSATKFIGCTFEDKPYQGKEPYGNYIIESNGAKRMSFTDCKFIANVKKLCWMDILAPKTNHEEKYQFKNCTFTIRSLPDSKEDRIGFINGVVLKNCTFDLKNQNDKNKIISLLNYKEGQNVDLGGNKIIPSY